MSELLNNTTVQAALVAVIVVALKALAEFIKSRVSHTALVDEYWCYLQPLVDAALTQTHNLVKSGTWGTEAGRDIVVRALVEFAADFRRMEGKEPTATVIAAASGELEQAVLRAAEGAK